MESTISPVPARVLNSDVKPLASSRAKEYLAGVASDQVCSICGETRFFFDPVRGELVCSNCGLVASEGLIDPGPEWRDFRDGIDVSRVGSPENVMLPDRGLATDISPSNRDHSGNRFSSRNQATFDRLRRVHSRNRYASSRDRGLAVGLLKLDALASRVGLPKDFRERAAIIYRKATYLDLVRGRSTEEVAGAALYVASRLLGAPRTLKEIASIAAVDPMRIAAVSKVLSRNLRLGVPAAKPEDYLPRFSSLLNLSSDVENLAAHMLRRYQELEHTTSASPPGLAAGALYLAGKSFGKKVTQSQVAKVSGVTEVTVRSNFNELKRRLGKEFPQSAVETSRGRHGVAS